MEGLLFLPPAYVLPSSEFYCDNVPVNGIMKEHGDGSTGDQT